MRYDAGDKAGRCRRGALGRGLQSSKLRTLFEFRVDDLRVGRVRPDALELLPDQVSKAVRVRLDENIPLQRVDLTSLFDEQVAGVTVLVDLHQAAKRDLEQNLLLLALVSGHRDDPRKRGQTAVEVVVQVHDLPKPLRVLQLDLGLGRFEALGLLDHVGRAVSNDRDLEAVEVLLELEQEVQAAGRRVARLDTGDPGSAGVKLGRALDHLLGAPSEDRNNQDENSEAAQGDVANVHVFQPSAYVSRL